MPVPSPGVRPQLCIQFHGDFTRADVRIDGPHTLVLCGSLLEGTVQDWLHLHAEATVASVEALALVERIAFVVKALHDCGCALLH